MESSGVKLARALLALVAVVVSVALATGLAFARGRGSHGQGHSHHNHRGHAHFGVVIPAPGWYYPPYYPFYAPPAETDLPGPIHYIEQSTAPEESGEYWYYCAQARAYYPNVTDCPAGWQRIVPAPVN